ncbi:hypothetical protein FIBSPDRAFT_896606 [Athelia psychrophila]|uniref:Uncharacterized protein n=1 Tax=Athelia psychrophila TaxID=1759441 RepID=A0A166D9X8_9AGAM|nr:hypothetical protein FIBSPDRAFT_896606 [Fibularhizoctonia sp. CBS 109695]
MKLEDDTDGIPPAASAAPAAQPVDWDSDRQGTDLRGQAGAGSRKHKHGCSQLAPPATLSPPANTVNTTSYRGYIGGGMYNGNAILVLRLFSVLWSLCICAGPLFTLGSRVSMWSLIFEA